MPVHTLMRSAAPGEIERLRWGGGGEYPKWFDPRWDLMVTQMTKSEGRAIGHPLSSFLCPSRGRIEKQSE